MSAPKPSLRDTEEQERQFWDDGFVVVHAFEPHELQPFHDIVDAWLSEVEDECASRLVQTSAVHRR